MPEGWKGNVRLRGEDGSVVDAWHLHGCVGCGDYLMCRNEACNENFEALVCDPCVEKVLCNIQ